MDGRNLHHVAVVWVQHPRDHCYAWSSKERWFRLGPNPGIVTTRGNGNYIKVNGGSCWTLHAAVDRREFLEKLDLTKDPQFRL